MTDTILNDARKQQPPKIDKIELTSEQLDEVSGGFVWGAPRIVPVRPPGHT